jgi:hypothetical protein
MIDIDQDKAVTLALTNRKEEIHIELDSLDRDIVRSTRENLESRVSDLQVIERGLVTELLDIVSKIA